MSSKRYTDEFRAEAVKQVLERGFTVVDVAARIGIPKHTLYDWVQKAKKAGRPAAGSAPPGTDSGVRRFLLNPWLATWLHVAGLSGAHCPRTVRPHARRLSVTAGMTTATMDAATGDGRHGETVMLKWIGGMVVLALSACASNAERLADTNVRPSDRAECLVGGDVLDTERASGVRSMRSKLCSEEHSASWRIGSGRGGSMEVDFGKKRD